MTYISRERLLRQEKSLYRLVLATAARANQLYEGAKPFIEADAKKPPTIALKEIACGKVTYKSADKPAKASE
ncbi:MAG: DNA-directed RNA polymerase subunit omega [Candidatus Omnitrophica bacterium]|nr:DNA-directed RNA polymerase subunit omega [Candidatus Omnitrophota bacterium]